MIPETAYFVKDVMGPRGSVSIVMDEKEHGPANSGDSANTNNHTEASKIRVSTVVDGREQDVVLSMEGEPDHYELCARGQRFLLDVVREDRDLTQHMTDAIRLLSIVRAVDRSMRESCVIGIVKRPGCLLWY
ncbi:hypothetical protein BBP40_001203 [Aspergillus hancockii]|nr:hypothetical protein BBP40_001203 [Aspergillus hancockii]